MKLLILISNPSIGGTETFLASICPFFVEKGINVSVLNTWKDSEVKQLILKKGVPYFELDNSGRSFSLKSIRSLSKFIRKNEFDMIMCFGIRISLLVRMLKLFLKTIRFTKRLCWLNFQQ